MIYLDNGATSFHKPAAVYQAVARAMQTDANSGRGNYGASASAAKRNFECREQAGKLFDCRSDQVVFTFNCTHGLNIAIHSLVKPGSRVVISGFEHNAVARPLYALGADVRVAGRRLFDWDDTLDAFRRELRQGADAAVFTHVSNAFGYILPIEQIAALCREYSVPFILDAAQSAGVLDVKLGQLGAEFIAMPGHKGLLGPQGTGLLLCASNAEPLLYGGTGSQSIRRDMPDELPERLEAGTQNGPGIAGLLEGLRYLDRVGIENIYQREHTQMLRCADGLRRLGMRVFTGPHQASTVSFLAGQDCEATGAYLARQGIAVRAGLHCSPLAHERAGTLESGTVRVSFGHDAKNLQTETFLKVISKLPPAKT